MRAKIKVITSNTNPSCPKCNERHTVGKLNQGIYFCRECVIEFNKRKDITFSYNGKYKDMRGA